MWAAGPSCAGGAGARLAALPADDLPLAPHPPRDGAGAPLAPLGPLAVAAGPHGQVVIAGADPGSPTQALAIQGRATGGFRVLGRFAGAVEPASLNTAWLGDVALAGVSTLSPTGVFVRIERFFADALGPAEATAAKTAGISSLTVAMDFRSDAVTGWAQGGEVHVRYLPAKGTRHAAAALGPVGADPHIAMLISDDYRSIVMWSGRQGEVTSVYMDYSAPGLSFGPPRLLERFRDPPGPAPSASPLLIRLSDESVMAAWAGASEGRWVVRTAPIDQHGLRAVSTIAAGDGDALLSALAAGPRDEAMLLLREPAPGGGQTLLSARGVDEAPGRTLFSTPQPIATGTIEAPAVALDPDSDRAVAAWRGQGGAILYSLGSPAAG